MLFDDIFSMTGAYGPYQAFMTVLCGSLCLWSVEVISQIFIDGKMDHWCAVPELRKFSKNKERYIAIPMTEDSTYDGCLMFDYDYANFTAKQLTHWDRKSMSTSKTRACNYGWTYDSPVYESTTVSRFDLVCDKELLIPTLSSCFMGGILIGALISGPVADTMGRKSMILIFLIVKVVGCAISMMASDFTIYAASRLILGIGNSGVYMGAFVLLIEVVGPEYRSNVGVFNGLLFGVGTMITAGLAYFFRTDFHMHIVVMVPTICMLTYYMLLDDSARWQLVTKRYEAAERGIKKMATWNGAVIPPDFDVKTIEVLPFTC